ncbi:putative sodium-coupled neutral amino acid transporter 10 [Danaus plexippus]|uniref:putative sodium-coupled neutral amino acid transporter 10 n=1 Tax=Danaus plexippus TaxID=13037 RepID=UPI002AAF4278|nr:putative sodium-coupled neutral amino acid transporter 10 [Danaus plexippus]
MRVTGVSITLANSIIGVGILAMPFCFQQCGIILATLILILMGLVSRLCCYFLLKSAIITRRRNYEFLAFHIFGSVGKTAIELGIIGFLMGTCVAYFVVVGDLGPQIIAKIFNINQSDTLRTSIMVIVSLVCVLPLGLLRNVDSLSNVSAATIAFYFCLVIKVIAEATSEMISSDWTSRIELWKPAGVLQCVPIFSMALFCQTQLFEIFESWPMASLDKMCMVTKNAINICSAVYFTLGVFGYIAFGSKEISGNILVSLSPTMASDVIKLGFVMSLAFSFPLIIFPCRESLYSFFYRTAMSGDRSAMSVRSHRVLTAVIVGGSLCCGVALPAVERVLGLLGSSAGTLVCLVFPAALYSNLCRREKGEKIAARLVVALGLMVLVLGSYANIKSPDPRDHYDHSRERERIDRIVEDFFHKMERSDEVMAKPEMQIPSRVEANNLENSIIKDSEVQPPNPVPPESHSDEKKSPPFNIVDSKLKQLVQERRELDKVPDAKPSNVQIKLNGEEVANGVKITKEENVRKDEEKMKEIKTPPNQDKIDIIKQQQLIETIKQHGEEQRELIKEQKEILVELKKTKDEMKKNKEESDSNDAKKIAVESIQKIADVAIKSLVGDTDKIEDKHSKPEEPIANIINKAVSDIAKKAEETLDAIKKKDEAKEDKPKEKLTIEGKVDKSVDKQKPVQKPQQIEDEPLKIVNEQDSAKADNAPVNNQNQFKMNEKLSPEENQNVKVIGDTKPKEHVHMPDEPQSYKQGEDVQSDKQKISNINNKETLPKDNKENLNKISQAASDNKEQNGFIYKETNILKDIANGNIIPRKKRETVDCTEKMLLKAESRQICLNQFNKRDDENKESYIRNVDLGEVDLQNSLPVHIRSLRSVDGGKNDSL